MPRINIELTVDGEAEVAMRAIDKLLDQGIIQDEIELQVAKDGERPLVVIHACSVWKQIPALRAVPSLKLALFIGVLVGMMGCATAPRAPEVETVGNLTASTTHVATAPVHATTDLSVAYQPAGGDEDAAEPMKTETKPDEAALPDVAPKTDGVTTGAVRQ